MTTAYPSILLLIKLRISSIDATALHLPITPDRLKADSYPASLSGKYCEGQDTRADKKQGNIGRYSQRSKTDDKQPTPANNMQPRPMIRETAC